MAAAGSATPFALGWKCRKKSEVDWHCPGCAWEIQEKEEAMGEE